MTEVSNMTNEDQLHMKLKSNAIIINWMMNYVQYIQHTILYENNLHHQKGDNNVI